MENNKFVLIPLHLWEQGTLQLSSIDTEPGDARIRFFKRKQPIHPGYIGKNFMTPKKIKDTDPPNQNERLKEYLLKEFRKDSNAKKNLSELFENSYNFSLNNTIVVDNVDTEVHARDFIHNLRRENGSFDLKYSIILNTLNFPQNYMTNTVALADDDSSWLFLKDSSWINCTGVDQQLLDHSII